MRHRLALAVTAFLLKAGCTVDIVKKLLGAVIELARLTETPTPHLDTVYALTKLLAKTLEESASH